MKEKTNFAAATPYVIGGWHMAEGKGVTWHDHGLVADLSEDPLEWKKLPKTDWVVRANSAAVAKGHLYVVGGLNDEGTTNAVRKLHLKSMKWSEVEDFPGANRLKAFGSAAVEIGGKLIVSAFSYQPKILMDSNRSWTSTEAKVQDKRFFHRLVPLDRSKVLFLGGASWDGHLDGIEVLDFSSDLEKDKKNAKAGKADSRSSHWGGFRGKGNSRTDSPSLPLGWSDERNLAWRMKIEGYGQSTPVIWGDRSVMNVFTTSTEGKESERLLVHCNSQGRRITLAQIGTSPVPIKRSQYVSQAAPSPVVDAGGVFVFFESGLLMGLSHSGEELWMRSLTDEYGPMMGNHGIGGSLFQTDDSLGLLVDHDGPGGSPTFCGWIRARERTSGKRTGRNESPGARQLFPCRKIRKRSTSVPMEWWSAWILRPAKSFGPRMVWRETPLLLLRLREIYSSWVLPSQNIRKPYDAAAKRRRGAKSLGLRKMRPAVSVPHWRPTASSTW